MISEQDARAKILSAIAPLPSRMLDIRDSRISSAALNAFVAEDIFARLSMPLFDNSAMDGYALVAPVEGKLKVIGEQPAGPDKKLRVSLGETVRIFTGAPIPEGANAVVMQEDVTRDGGQITVNEKVELGEFIRRRGCDLAEGQKLFAAGERITPAMLALLVAQGFTEVKVGGEVTAAVLSTGDELTQPGNKLESGLIYDSNSPLLAALLGKTGAAVVSVEHCRDDFDALCAAIGRGAQSRILVISGGVSVGEHDLVRRALETLGAEINVWRVAIKPGKPFLFAQMKLPSLPLARASLPAGKRGNGENSPKSDCFVFGLPGNPVSAYVTFFRFVRPAILKMMGAHSADFEPERFPARLTVDVSNDDPKRPHYLRGKFVNGAFTPVGRQESHALFGLSRSNAITRLEPGTEVQAGTMVSIEIWE